MQVIRVALDAAGLQASDISCLEMHGTGTPLGDPIEIGAAAAVFGKPSLSVNGQGAQPSQALCLGAVKSTLGHTEPAAGATGISRTLFRCACSFSVAMKPGVKLRPQAAEPSPVVIAP